MVLLGSIFSLVRSLTSEPMVSPPADKVMEEKQLNIQDEKESDIPTVDSNVHLQTPDMSDQSCDEAKLNSEPDEASTTWTKDLENELKQLAGQSITFSKVLTHFPGFDWKDIGEKILKTKINNSLWKRKLVCYDQLFKHEKAFVIRAHSGILSRIDDKKLKSWKNHEIEQLLCNLYEDLTTDGVKASLTNKSLKQVAEAIHVVAHVVSWTPKELQFLMDNFEDQENLKKGLFFRSSDSIYNKLRLTNQLSTTAKSSGKSKHEDALNKISTLPISFSKVMEQFPAGDWKDIATTLYKLTADNESSNWSQKIGCYCLVNHFDQFAREEIDDEFLTSIGYTKNEFKKFRNNLCKALALPEFKKWSTKEFEDFYSLSFHDLTRDTLRQKFPKKNLTDMKKFVSVFDSQRNNFNSGEITYLEQNSDAKISELMLHLPCRSKKSIYKALDDLNNPESEENPVLLQLLQHDLTIDTIKENFPDEDIESIINDIKNHPEFDKDMFTKGEKELMNSFVHANKNVEECLKHFPVRDEKSIRRLHNESQYLSGRKVKFESPEERLAYEAKWTLIATGSSNSSRSKRALKRSADFEEFTKLEQEVAVKHIKKPKPELTEEELALRREKQEKARLARERKKEERRKLIELRKLEKKPKPKKQTTSNELKDLLTGAEYFQSTVGDRKQVQEGEKRKRVQPEHYEPEIRHSNNPVKLKTTNRQAEKIRIKKELQRKARAEKEKELAIKSKNQIKQLNSKRKKQQLQKRSKSKIPDDDEIIAEIKRIYNMEAEQQQLDDSEEEEEFISPYDPPDITSDSFVKLNGRQLYVSDFYSEEPSIPQLEFVHIEQNDEDDADSKVKSMSPGKSIMTAADDKILYEDNLALEIVTTHMRSYRDMPISFPPILDPVTKEINPLNIIKIRFLLYPEHTELFILASPKSNELDPVQEIAKLFMIQCSLYFSHSEVLKNIIMEDYCKKLENSIEENDFGEFMAVIDKWNQLVLNLSPNTSSSQKILESGEDINSAPRYYLNEEEVKTPTVADLKLDTFYEEIMYESASPSFQPIEIKFGDDITVPDTNNEVSYDNVDIPTNISQVSRIIKPEGYNTDFFKRLQEKTDVSRYTIQQILLRIYSRVVSTDSRKLRSYKAFTAEVYGELLPSFTSEVLEKVNLLPGQKFYDLGSGVGNTTFQAALEFGASPSGGCEIMDHASYLTTLQTGLIQKHLSVLGLRKLDLDFELHSSFVNNEKVRQSCLECNVLIINNYLFDGPLNAEVGRLLVGLKPGTKIISLRSFISPRYRATFDTVFDFLRVEKHEMSDVLSVSWTANKVPYYISTVEESILKEYLSKEETADISERSKSSSPVHDFGGNRNSMLTPPTDSSELENYKE